VRMPPLSVQALSRLIDNRCVTRERLLDARVIPISNFAEEHGLKSSGGLR